MVAPNMPAAEVDVTVDRMREVLADQHPDLAGRPLRIVAHGWDNVIFRLGDDLAVRVPRRAVAADLVDREQRWLPILAPRLPLPVPVPIRRGRPAPGVPWSWSVVPWLPGEMAADAPLGDPVRSAVRLGEFVAALHAAAPDDAPRNAFRRGASLDGLDERVAANLDALEGQIDADACRRRWAELRSAPAWADRPCWVHGDLHTANVLVNAGEISGVVDLGDLTAGDPAVDLAIAWMLFDPPTRAVFRAASGRSEPGVWARAQAWALHFALLYVRNPADDRRFRSMGHRLLHAVLADDAPRIESR